MPNEVPKLEERVAVRIRRSRVEVGALIGTAFVVPATIKMSGRVVTREITPTGDSVIEFATREEAEQAVLASGFRPIW